MATKRTTSKGLVLDPKVARLGEGLGAANSNIPEVVKAIKGSLCAVYALPTVAKTQWDLQGPISNNAVQKTFGSTISIFANPDPLGVDVVYSTPGLNNGQFQTPVLVCAIAVHLEISPFMCVIPGNSFVRPASPPVTEPFSPDSWTSNDITNSWVGSTGPTARAELVYGEPAARAMWAMVRAYNLRWTYGSQINILDEQLRETAYMPPNGQDGSSSSSELDVLRIAREVNDRYSNPTILASVEDFLSIDTIRTGSVGNAPNLGTFAPSNDFKRVAVTYGGADLRGKIGIGQNSEFRTLTNPRILRAGVPIGMEFDERNTALGDLMRAELDATQGFGGPVPPFFTDSSDFNTGATSAYIERTIDGLNVSQTNVAGTKLYKGFNLLISNEMKGWELSEGLMHQIMSNPELGNALCSECGILVTWGQ